MNVQVSFLLIQTLISTSWCQQSTLKLAHVVYRHCDRSPSITFPNDIWKDHWKDGPDQLTNLGKQQHYALGQYLRQRYDQLLNSSYKSDDIAVRSTDFDRTLMGAYCTLAGLYPPTGNQVWNKDILWQPIPVHTVPTSEDYLLYNSAPCPKLDDLGKKVEEEPEMKAATERLEKLSPFLSNQTGTLRNTPKSIEELHDFYHIQQMHNFPLPEWIDNVMKEIELYQMIRTTLFKKYPEVYKLRGGPLLTEMISNVENKIAGNITKSIFLYGGHDHTIEGLLQALQVFNDIDASYCSTVMVELHEDAKNEKSIQIFYRNTTTDSPFELSMPNCSSPCPLQKFKELTANMAVHDFGEECKI